MVDLFQDTPGGGGHGNQSCTLPDTARLYGGLTHGTHVLVMQPFQKTPGNFKATNSVRE